jgi:hypothetical protein
MIRSVFAILLLAGLAAGQTPFGPGGRQETFRKESPSLQAAINDVINTTVPGIGLIAPARATYLEGYGLIVTLEVSLEPTRNPFSSVKTPAEVRTIVTQRRAEIREKLRTLIKQRVPSMESIGPAESVAVIVHMLNTNPADMPDIPLQLVLSMKKQDGLDLQAGRIPDTPALISVREF